MNVSPPRATDGGSGPGAVFECQNCGTLTLREECPECGSTDLDPVLTDGGAARPMLVPENSGTAVPVEVDVPPGVWADAVEATRRRANALAADEADDWPYGQPTVEQHLIDFVNFDIRWFVDGEDVTDAARSESLPGSTVD